MSRSTAALLIAVMFHILLILLFKFLMDLKPERLDKPKEQRIKVALKQKPKSSKKSAALDNKQKPIQKAPPMPKGKQLEKLAKQAKQIPPKPAATKKTAQKQAVEKPRPKKKPEPKKPEPKKPIVKKVSKKKAPYKHVEKIQKEDVNITRKPPKKKTGLYAALSKKQKPQQHTKRKAKTGTHIGQDFKEAYGEEFGKLSEGEKKYIIDNQEIMRRITQEQLNRLGPVNIPRNLNVNTMNIIEFYLHPNGDISGLKIINESGYEILDDTSLQTIEYSYHRYPLPQQKTKIRYKVGYYLAQGRP